MSPWQAAVRLIAGGAIAALAAAAFGSAPAALPAPVAAGGRAVDQGAAGVSPAREKSYAVGGALTLAGTFSYFISNADGVVNLQVARLQNDSFTTTSGTIILRLFLTTTPISGAFTYWIVGDYTLSPLPPQSYYDGLDVTVPLLSVPDGIYYAHLGAFEFENSCGSASGYCSDDYIQFNTLVQVVNGVYSNYNPGGVATATAIEYYWASRDHYFFSTNPAEIAALDASPSGGWARTGYTFGAYATEEAGSSPVCRFYIPPQYGDSHFYSASPAECAATRARFPVLVYESPNVTFLNLPDTTTGACPVGRVPLYRLWNNRADTNHRYTTSVAIRDLMLSRGYVLEGYGPDVVSACAPQ